MKEGSKVELLCAAEMEHGSDLKVEWKSKVSLPRQSVFYHFVADQTVYKAYMVRQKKSGHLKWTTIGPGDGLELFSGLRPILGFMGLTVDLVKHFFD